MDYESTALTAELRALKSMLFNKLHITWSVVFKSIEEVSTNRAMCKFTREKEILQELCSKKAVLSVLFGVFFPVSCRK